MAARFQKTGEASFNYPHSRAAVGQDNREVRKSLPLTLLPHLRPALIPWSGLDDDLHHQQHHWHFDQDANHRREGRARLESEQTDRRSHRQLEKVAGAYQR
jgi:hypothetical protein